jgi:acyl-CoA synthetase (NDP forming)
VIALYIEGIRRGADFVRVAREVSLRKPIVAYYAGGTKTGKRAGMGHTGAVAGPEVLYDGAFRQAGILKATNITELFQMAWALGSLPLPRGERVVVQTHSGGPGAAASDAAGRAGFDMPELGTRLVNRLREYLPGTANVKNPVDVTFSKNFLAYYQELPRLLLEAEETDILFFYSFLPWERVEEVLKHMGVPEEEMEVMARRRMETQAGLLKGLMEETQKHIMCLNYRDFKDPYVRALIDQKVPVFLDPHLGARVMRAMADYGRWLEKRKGAQGGRDAQ